MNSNSIILDPVQIIEVGPRDGLQNESTSISTLLKFEWVQGLIASGIQEIELTSFVSPKWVPQLADAEALAQLCFTNFPDIRFNALVPNLIGLERAAKVGFQRFGVLTAASEAFTLKNTKQTLAQSLEICKNSVEVLPKAWFRGYVSTAFDCPYQGPVSVDQCVEACLRLLDTGVYEICLGDTIGTATPQAVEQRLERLLQKIPAHQIALHFHDTWGLAIASAWQGYQMGIRRFDGSAAGLGGCPYAPGASGNVATEDLCALFEKQNIKTKVLGKQVALQTQRILSQLNKDSRSKAHHAFLSSEFYCKK